MSELFTVKIVEIGSVTCEQCEREWDTSDVNDMKDYELHHECDVNKREAYAKAYGYPPSVVNDPIARECEGCNAEPYEPCREGCLSTVV